MSDDGKAPKLSDWLREHIFQRFGILGLVGLAFASGGFFVWTQWGTIKAWPGISSVVAYLEREVLPQADPHRFSVAVAHLEDDGANREHERLIVRLLQDFEGFQVLTFDRTISVKGPVPEERAREGHQRAREYLKKSKASVLIWGSVLSYGGQSRLDLYLTAADGEAGRSKQYAPEIDTEFRLPNVFWADLADVLRLVITMQVAEWAERSHYVADLLLPFVERVRSLLKASAGQPGWDADALTSTRVILAYALKTLGDQSGKNEPLKEAIASLRAALQELTRERVPLQWARTQANLGTVLGALGEREGGTARLEEAVEAFRAALQELTRERVPLQWARTQANLGRALATLGEREGGTQRLEEAAEAFRAALQELTRERAPLQWAGTQNNLGYTLVILGERESGTARFEEAVAACHKVLKELTRERVPHGWAMTQDTLGRALAGLGVRESGTARLEEAVEAFRAALQELTREQVPLDWATTQMHLGTALATLGEREGGTQHLEEAIAAYESALDVFVAAQAPYYASVARDNLERARARLAQRRQ